MTYPQTLNYLYSRLPMFQRIGSAAYKADLNNTIALMQVLEHPEKKFRSIHVAGTNGKGSSSHLLASVLQSAGYKTGLYTSPHLKDFRERIRINGRMIPQKKVCEFVEKYKNQFEKIEPSFFEWTVGLAFHYFTEENVDVAIIEVGLGGRLDSTNVILPELSLITNIGWDHMNLLGKRLKDIALEKAGIIKKGVPVIVSEKQRGIAGVFKEVAKKQKSKLLFATDQFKVIPANRSAEGQVFKIKEKDKTSYTIHIDLPGIYQRKNIAGVLASIDVLQNKGWKIPNTAIEHGLKNSRKQTGLRGRWEQLQTEPLIICDTGHNKNGIEEINKNITLTPHRKLHWVIGMVNDKDPDKVLRLLPKNAVYYFCRPNIPRGMDETLLKKEALKQKLKGISYTSVSEALEAAKKAAKRDDLVFIGGSTFVVAEVL